MKLCLHKYEEGIKIQELICVNVWTFFLRGDFLGRGNVNIN